MMKYLKHITTILFIASILTSCGNDSKKVTTEIENATKTVKNAEKVVDRASDIKDNMLLLRNTTPLTKAQFESWLPETLLDMPLANSQINLIPGLHSCAANYRLGNSRIRVMIFDGAGEKGASGVGPYRMSSEMDYDTDDQWNTTKTVIIEGHKAKKNMRKTSGTYNLSMFYAERFAVDIKTENIAEDVVEKIVKELNLSELKNL